MKALILAGGSGTRFWPASRHRRPKQLLDVLGGRSFLRRTLDRLLPMLEPSDVWICTGEHLVEEVAAQLPEVPRDQILAEPLGRNTAPAIAWTLLSLSPEDRDEVVVSLHSDHWIADEEAFRSSLQDAVDSVAADNRVMALGVRPRWAETGYGYMEVGAAVDAQRGVFAVEEFLEKPELALARQFFEGGRHVWNSGIFLFQAGRLLADLERLQPTLMSKLGELAGGADLATTYAALESIPIDTAVMERLDEMATVVLDCGWSDVGSWDALAGILDSDADGNAIHGRAIAVDSRDNVLWSEGTTIAVLGVEGLAVVETEGAVLVIPKERAQDVREIVAELRRSGRDDLL